VETLPEAPAGIWNVCELEAPAYVETAYGIAHPGVCASAAPQGSDQVLVRLAPAQCGDFNGCCTLRHELEHTYQIRAIQRACEKAFTEIEDRDTCTGCTMSAHRCNLEATAVVREGIWCSAHGGSNPDDYFAQKEIIPDDPHEYAVWIATRFLFGIVSGAWSITGTYDPATYLATWCKCLTEKADETGFVAPKPNGKCEGFALATIEGLDVPPREELCIPAPIESEESPFETSATPEN